MKIMDADALMPGLPDDVALLCLVRVHHSSLPVLKCVNRRLKKLISSEKFREGRRHVNANAEFLYAIDSAQGLADQKLKFLEPENCKWVVVSSLTRGMAENFLSGFRMESIESEILIIGGNKHSQTLFESVPSSEVWKFDTVSRVWEQGCSMLQPRAHFAAARYGLKVFVAGGSTRGPSSSDLREAEVYDSKTRTWQALPPMRYTRGLCVGVCLRGRFVVIGSRPRSEAALSIEIFDPATSLWTLFEEALPGPRDSPLISLDNGFTVFKDKLYHFDSSGHDPWIRVYSEEKNVWLTEESLRSSTALRRFTLHHYNENLCIVGGTVVGSDVVNLGGFSEKRGWKEGQPYVYEFVSGPIDKEEHSFWRPVCSPMSCFPGRSVWACVTVHL